MKPILFSTEMVRAILNGHKTETRRVVKPQPAGDGSKPEPLKTRPGYWNAWGDDFVYRQPYAVGDILYVRETTCYDAYAAFTQQTFYKADYKSKPNWVARTVPSIHMPKEAARIFLRVTEVRVERLQDIDDTGAKAEGANGRDGKNVGWVEKMRRSSIERFSEIWDSTIKPADLDRYGWEANPWVWAIEFERCEKPEEKQI